MRRAQSVLATGLLLGGLFAATAQSLSLPPQINFYQLKSNYVSGAVAPYNSGGGVAAAAYQTGLSIVGTNFTLSWYGVMGWYTIQAMNNSLGGPWVNLATVASTNFGNSYTAPKPDPTNSYSFQLALINNYFVGSDQCSSCHGNKYSSWSKTTHAGVYNNPNVNSLFSTACLTVGAGQTSGFVDAATTPNLENVGCENCHGPAAWHKNSEHDAILPVVSLDPAICGSCHQGGLHPTYQEYTNVISSTLSSLPLGIIKGGVSHSAGDHGNGCAVCHEAVNRMVMVNEYYDKLAGSPHPLSWFPSPNNGILHAATCETCHDPHSSNYVAQLRYPAFSTNYSHVVPLLLTTSQVVSNYNGTWTFTTNTLTMNNVFDQ